VITQLEELALNAGPALQTLLYDGWLLRHARGYTRRANSVQPLYPSTEDVAAKVAYCEQFYRERGLDTIFKLTRESQPAELDDFLTRRGYSAEAPTSVQTLDLTGALPQPTFAPISSDFELTSGWLADLAKLNHIPDSLVATVRRLLQSIVPQHVFLGLREGDQNIALGIGVVDRGSLGLFDLVTAPEWRSQGLGRQLTLHLLHWGQLHGATSAYLQVQMDNVPALKIYSSLGFKEQYQYWYRVRPRGS
jgi:GNAT superfamily N-acetyltransferase